jgi:hypothetical protein
MTICKNHGGSLPSVKAKSAQFREARDMEKRGIGPVSEEDPEGRGDVALATEIRRTIGWIRYCEDQINALGGPEPRGAADDPLAERLGGLQLVSDEHATGEERGEDTDLRTKKWSAGVNVWEEKLRWNRAHLATLTRQWIAAGFEARRLEIQTRTLDILERTIDGILSDLGHNPRDPDTRAVVRHRLDEASRPREITA